MSAIWGVISKEKNGIEKKAHRMRESMQEFVIDRYDDVLHEKVYFACGHRYVTELAKKDVSPYYDKDTETYFTADCYLINREELIKNLRNAGAESSERELEKCGDATLAFHAYQMWGEGFVEYMKGSFGIAIYRALEKTLLLYTDHVAQRYLAYYMDDTEAAFSTGYHPLLALLGDDRIKVCRKWIAASYTDCTADTIKFPRQSVYEGIYHVEPGHYVKMDMNTRCVQNISYWNPLYDAPKLPKMNDEECKERFLFTFEKVMKGMLRAKGEIGIMLSGGLDSSSVAAMAAIPLAREKKKLYSYTAVPASDYEYQNNRINIENEKELVLLQQKLHPNLCPRFINVEQENCFSRLELYVKTYRQPVKSALNMINLEGMIKAAGEDGCSILLSGQNGNATISYGSLLSFINQKCMSGHFVAAYKEIKAFGRLRRVPRKRILKVFLKNFGEEKFSKISFGEDCLVRQEDMKEFRLEELEKRSRRERGSGFIDSKKQRRNFCFMPLVFQHMGFYDTYNSLKYGVLPLDPTLSKDMIELCIELPVEFCVRNGRERRLIRDYMKGYVPDEILENHVGRGCQAADYAYRVNRDWDKVKMQVYEVLGSSELQEYLDKAKLQTLLEEAKEKEYAMDKNLVARLAVITSLGYFLRMKKDV